MFTYTIKSAGVHFIAKRNPATECSQNPSTSRTWRFRTRTCSNFSVSLGSVFFFGAAETTRTNVSQPRRGRALPSLLGASLAAARPAGVHVEVRQSTPPRRIWVVRVPSAMAGSFAPTKTARFSSERRRYARWLAVAVVDFKPLPCSAAGAGVVLRLKITRSWPRYVLQWSLARCGNGRCFFLFLNFD